MSTTDPKPAQQDLTTAELPQLAIRQNQLRAQIGQLEGRRASLVRQQQSVGVDDRAKLTTQLADVDQRSTLASAELELVTLRIDRVLTQFGQGATTAVPASVPGSVQQPLVGDGAAVASLLLLLPLAIAFGRRVWSRGGPRVTAIDLEFSSSLHRIEQAVESMSVEVERISEAQRFTTKLLSERTADAAAHVSATPRQVLRTNTPH
jgi:hypothetical protein